MLYSLYWIYTDHYTYFKMMYNIGKGHLTGCALFGKCHVYIF